MKSTGNTGNGVRLRRDFGGDFSGGAFHTIDEEVRIIGRYGQITQLDDGLYDAWFVGPGLAPLSALRLSNLAREFHCSGGFHRLTGEGWVQGRGRDFVLLCARLCGIKKKRQVSEATRRECAQRLAAVRAAQSIGSSRAA